MKQLINELLKYLIFGFMITYAESTECLSMCLNEGNLPIKGMCPNTSGICPRVQEYFNEKEYIPMKFKRINDSFAYFLSQDAESWKPRCLNFGTNVDYNFSAIQSILTIIAESYKILSIWLPAKRADINQFRYELPLPHNMILNDIQTPYEYQEKLCVKLRLNDSKHEMADCNEKHHTLCIVDISKLDLLELACNEGYTTWYSNYNDIRANTQDKCFNILRRGGGDKVAVIDSKEMQFIFHKTLNLKNKTKDTIRFKLLPNGSDMFNYERWNATKYNQSAFVNWNMNTDVNQSNVASFVDIETGHWILKESERFGDVFYQSNKIERLTPRIVLRYIADDDNLLVTLTNWRYLYRNNNKICPINCFTMDQHGETFNSCTLNKSYQNSKKEFVMRWKLQIHDKEHYGYEQIECTGYAIPNFTKISSGKYIFSRNRNLGAKSISQELFAIQFQSDHIPNFSDNNSEFIDFKGANRTFILSFLERRFTLLRHIYIVPNRSHYMTRYEIKTEILNYIKTNYPELHVLNIRHTEFCMSHNDTFSDTKIGEMAFYNKQHCDRTDNLPPTQECTGSNFLGAYWKSETIVNEAECDGKEKDDDNSKSLFDLTKHTTKESVQDALNILETKPITTSTQISYIAQIVKTTANLPAADKPVNDTILKEVTKLTNFIIDSSDLIRKSQEINSTNNFANSLELIATKYAYSPAFAANASTPTPPSLTTPTLITPTITTPIETTSEIEYLDIQRNVIVMIVNPETKKIYGIGVYNPPGSKCINDFRECNVVPIKKKTVYDKEPNLDIGAFVPQKVLTDMGKNTGGDYKPDRIIFLVYNNGSSGSLLQETNRNENYTTSRIIRILIPNFEVELPGDVFTYFSSSLGKLANSGAIHWNNTGSFGKWDKHVNVCERDNIRTKCAMKRQANVGFLNVFGSHHNSKSESETMTYHEPFFSIISHIMCSLSILGTSLIIITYVRFQLFRVRLLTSLLIHLCFAILIQMFVHETKSIIVPKGVSDNVCFTFALLLHYIILVSFALTLFAAHIQLKRFVDIFPFTPPRYFELIIILVAWCTPLLFVTGSIFTQYQLSNLTEFSVTLYTNMTYNYNQDENMCYPSGNMLRYTLHVPILLILIINFVIYIRIMYSILSIRHIRKDQLKSISSSKSVLHEIQLFVYAIFLFSLTWIFGFVYHYTETEWLTTFCAYAFIILGASQGFVIFLVTLVFDSKSRSLWISKFKYVPFIYYNYNTKEITLSSSSNFS